MTLMKTSPKSVREELQKRGYDGLIDDMYGQRAVFSEDQIKVKSNDDLIKEDVEILTQLNNKQQEVNQPSKVPENYQEPKRQKATTGTITQRERAVIDRDGYTEDYDADIAAYKALQNRRIIQDDEIVDADEFMKSIDDEIKGIDDVLRCAIG